MERTILIASTNPGKLVELGALLNDLPLRLLLPADAGIRLHVEETGSTYAENAALKAAAYFQASGLVTLADDSGLDSARFSPRPGASDADRRALLRQKLVETGSPRPWTARFRCVVTIAAPGRAMQFREGTIEGEIWPEERGSNGFGYDPLFYMPDLGQTMAELPDEMKNTLSHRGRAVAQARAVLIDIFGLA